MNQPNTARPANDPRYAKQAPQDQQPLQEDEELQGGNRFVLFNVMPSWMVSFLTHMILIIVLAWFILPSPSERSLSLDSGQAASTDVDNTSMSFDTFDEDEVSDALESDAEEMTELDATDISSEVEDFAVQELESFDVGTIMTGMDDFSAGEGLGDLSADNETALRTGEGKKAALLKNGGSQASEDAVQLALQWIVKHQLEDGSWCLDHTIGPGKHRDSPNPGTRVAARNGATALALLPLLGAGNTHVSGEYKKQVRYGLEYLKKRARVSRNGTALVGSGDDMYSHGLCAIVFNELYAMTQDPELKELAQGSIKYIEHAQDPVGGGWRYIPRERGDTSAVGWQLMALKSGKLSGLTVNQRTYKRASKFLDSVSTSNGAFYGYMDPPIGRPANARTAVGLLCRMYMGWDRNVPGLVDGMEAIADNGPSTGRNTNMYYNYYATQAMKHMYSGKSEWNTWNKRMRDFLVESQAKQGNAAGSWHFGRDHAASVGGRLYNTAMAAMTLEVYYRFLPLYGDKAANDEFELLE